MLTEDDKATLYGTLVDICQAYGFTTGHTYDLLHDVVESIVDDDPDAGLEVGEDEDEAYRDDEGGP